MSFVLALDQGTTSSRAIVFDRAGAIRASAQQEFRQIFPQPGWVEHDPTEIWATQSGVLHEALAKARHRRARRRRDRHHEPARDDRGVGARDRPPHRQRDRLAGPPHRADVRRAARGGAARRCSPRRPASCSTPTSPAPSCAGCSTTSPARGRARDAASSRSARSTRWLVWQLTGGRVHCTDATQREPHAALRHPDRRLGRRAAARCSTFRARCCRASSRRPASAAEARIGGRERPDRRHRGRPAGGALRAGVPVARDSRRTPTARLLPADEHRRQGGRSRNNLLTTVAWRRGGTLDYALEGSVFIGGAVVQWLRDGLQIIRSAAEIEALAASGPGQRRRVPRARRSPGWARRTGTPTRAARSSA